MATATLTIPDDTKKELDSFSWINWSEVARESFLKGLRRDKAWEEVERIVSKSKLTQEQADKISDKINTSLAKRYEALLKRKK